MLEVYSSPEFGVWTPYVLCFVLFYPDPALFDLCSFWLQHPCQFLVRTPIRLPPRQIVPQRCPRVYKRSMASFNVCSELEVVGGTNDGRWQRLSSTKMRPSRS